MTKGGDLSPMDGQTHTKESKVKMSLAQSGRTHSEETKKKMSLYNLGKKLSISTKDKIRQKAIGRTHSEETKKKMSLSSMGNTNSLGNTLSEETKAKISEYNKGKTGIESFNTKIIIQIDRDTDEEIACWFGANEISRETGILQPGVQRCCVGNQKTAGGYKWIYM